jgi:hypothetical protein
MEPYEPLYLTVGRVDFTDLPLNTFHSLRREESAAHSRRGDAHISFPYGWNHVWSGRSQVYDLPNSSSVGFGLAFYFWKFKLLKYSLTRQPVKCYSLCQ